MGHSWLSDCWESKLSAVHRTQVYGSRGVKLQSQIPPQPPPPLLHSSLPAPLLPLSPTSRHYLPQAARNESNTSQIGAGRGNQFSELLVCPETDLREWSSVTARATASPPLLWWLVRGAASITRRQDYEFENNLTGVLLLLGAPPASLVWQWSEWLGSRLLSLQWAKCRKCLSSADSGPRGLFTRAL